MSTVFLLKIPIFWRRFQVVHQPINAATAVSSLRSWCVKARWYVLEPMIMGSPKLRYPRKMLAWWQLSSGVVRFCWAWEFDGFFLHGNLFDSLRFWSIYKLGRCMPCSFGLCYVSHHILASSDVPAKAWKMCQRAVWSGEAGLFRLVIKWSTWIRWSFGPRVLNPSQTLWANNRNKFHIRFPWCKLSWRLNLPPFAHCPLLEETEQLR